MYLAISFIVIIELTFYIIAASSLYSNYFIISCIILSFYSNYFKSAFIFLLSSINQINFSLLNEFSNLDKNQLKLIK